MLGCLEFSYSLWNCRCVTFDFLRTGLVHMSGEYFSKYADVIRRAPTAFIAMNRKRTFNSWRRWWENKIARHQIKPGAYKTSWNWARHPNHYYTKWDTCTSMYVARPLDELLSIGLVSFYTCVYGMHVTPSTDEIEIMIIIIKRLLGGCLPLHWTQRRGPLSFILTRMQNV